MIKKFIMALLIVLLVTGPAMALDITAGIKTGGYLSDDDLGIPGASSKSFSSPDGDAMIPPIEVEGKLGILEWLSVSALVGTHKGGYETLIGEVDARSVYGMLMPRLEMPSTLGTVFGWIGGLSGRDDVPPPDEVIPPKPPIFDPARDFDPDRRVNAYVGVGVGTQWTKIEWEGENVNEWNLCYAPSVGASWAFNAMLSMTFDYRYMLVNGDDLGNVKGHLFLVGLGYTF